MSILVVGSVAFDASKLPPVAGIAASAARRPISLSPPATSPTCASSPSSAKISAPKQRPSSSAARSIPRASSTRWQELPLDRLLHEEPQRGPDPQHRAQCLQSFSPKIPAEYRTANFSFWPTSIPCCKAAFARKMPKVSMVCGDTMNYWITDHGKIWPKCSQGSMSCSSTTAKPRMLAENNNLVLAARKILDMGPKALVVKHGEYGATAFFGDRSFSGGDGSVPCRSAHPPCHWPKSSIPLEQAIPLPADSSAISPRSRGYACSLSPRHVLWRCHGLLCGGALRHGTPAAPQARGDRGTLRALPPALAS